LRAEQVADLAYCIEEVCEGSCADLHTLEESKAETLGIEMERRIFPEGNDDKGEPYENLRWSRFKNFEAREMMRIVDEHVFPFASLLGASAAISENFSCSFGRGACLGYGDTICSSNGKCVDSSALCFDAYQCGYEGFTCKSNVSECISDYNDLLSKHNGLVNDYNELLGRNRELVDDYNELVGSTKRLRGDLEDAEDAIRNLKSCVSYASTLAEAQDCDY